MRWFDTAGRSSSPSARPTRSTPIDLTDASEPRLMGELKIPGFSEYLHPLGAMRLIGVGQDASLHRA